MFVILPTILNLLMLILFLAAPGASLAFFIVSLIRYCSGKSANKKVPNSVSPRSMGTRRTCLILSSIILAALILAVIGLVVLIGISIAYM